MKIKTDKNYHIRYSATIIYSSYNLYFIYYFHLVVKSRGEQSLGPF